MQAQRRSQRNAFNPSTQSRKLLQQTFSAFSEDAVAQQRVQVFESNHKDVQMKVNRRVAASGSCVHSCNQ